MIGHDGSEEGYPSHPKGRRCFNDAEILVAAYQLNIYFATFIKQCIISPDQEYQIDSLTFKRILDCHSGILSGNWHGRRGGHSVVWDHTNCVVHDPSTGRSGTLEHLNERLNVEVFHAWINP